MCATHLTRLVSGGVTAPLWGVGSLRKEELRAPDPQVPSAGGASPPHPAPQRCGPH